MVSSDLERTNLIQIQQKNVLEDIFLLFILVISYSVSVQSSSFVKRNRHNTSALCGLSLLSALSVNVS